MDRDTWNDWLFLVGCKMLKDGFVFVFFTVAGVLKWVLGWTMYRWLSVELLVSRKRTESLLLFGSSVIATSSCWSFKTFTEQNTHCQFLNCFTAYDTVHHSSYSMDCFGFSLSSISRELLLWVSVREVLQPWGHELHSGFKRGSPETPSNWWPKILLEMFFSHFIFLFEIETFVNINQIKCILRILINSRHCVNYSVFAAQCNKQTMMKNEF